MDVNGLDHASKVILLPHALCNMVVAATAWPSPEVASPFPSCQTPNPYHQPLTHLACPPPLPIRPGPQA